MAARKARWREPMQLDLLGGPAVPASMTPAYAPLARRDGHPITPRTGDAGDPAPTPPSTPSTGAPRP